ncbi:POU class 2 homeobox associating-factor 2 isoform X3 [Myxocyprinus asiaticus]|uniref:POU class 2 homeobox associating-factor 2 isoform X3 n=1 Tax=Myxocyprinus asiaticus TaxID=70543 RepID=UPI0022228A12|nr:POU class 2 homeobox associating-factor 2 isoform X3 [Myxocyprinus asiaticus]
MESECSKRVYQGVRVKHTVKDLLAEKRSQQTNGPRYTGVSTPQSPFVQMTGSHMLPSYYDSYYPESFGDYRSTPFSSGGSTIFSPSALTSLLPPYSSDPSHYLLRDSWEHTGTEVVENLCGDGLAPMPLSAPSSLANPENASPTQYRSSSRGSSMTSSQSYSLHSLDEVNYQTPFQSTSGSFTSPSFVTESASKMTVLPSEDTESAPPALSDSLAWGREDTASTWSQYEVRRAF